MGIVIFYDRVSKMAPNQVHSVLAHVLVHEVTVSAGLEQPHFRRF